MKRHLQLASIVFAALLWPDSGLSDGAIAGRHEAIVMPKMQEGPDDEAPVPVVAIHRRFASYQTSELEFEVSENSETNNFTLVVEPPGRR